jgi:hypothetical protein
MVGNLKNLIMKKRSKIHIENCQVKSLEKARILAQTLDTLEKEFGIHEVEISFKDMFICPDIDLTQIANSEGPMERLIGNLFIKFDQMKYGKNSSYKKSKS